MVFGGDNSKILETRVVMLGAVAVVIMNLFVDIAYAFLDPRVRYA